MASDVIATVREVMERHQVPEWVWRPILLLESGGNPLARAVTPREESIGLFQINVKAHPEFAGLDLTDPATNAEIAARYFLAPAYQKVRDVPDPAAQAEYVWRYGIRPAWSAEKAQAIRTLATRYAPAGTEAAIPDWRTAPGIVSGISYLPAGTEPVIPDWRTAPGIISGFPGIGLPPGEPGAGTGPEGERLSLVERISATAWGLTAYAVLAVVALLSLYLLLRPEGTSVMKLVQEKGKEAAKALITRG